MYTEYCYVSHVQTERESDLPTAVRYLTSDGSIAKTIRTCISLQIHPTEVLPIPVYSNVVCKCRLSFLIKNGVALCDLIVLHMNCTIVKSCLCAQERV